MHNKDLVQFSNQLLSNLFVMSVKLRRYHWYVKGTHFFQLHEKFGTLYETCDDYIDELAERILAIDGKPFATMVKFLKETTIEEATADDLTEEIVDQLIKDLTQICDEVREHGFEKANDLRDEGTFDLFVSILTTFEKQIWMFNAFKQQ